MRANSSKKALKQSETALESKIQAYGKVKFSIIWVVIELRIGIKGEILIFVFEAQRGGDQMPNALDISLIMPADALKQIASSCRKKLIPIPIATS